MKKILLIYLFVLFIFLWCTNNFCDAADLRIHFIDVGEGDSILIQTPKDNAILIDAGNIITGFKVLKYLNRNNIDSLDYLIFSHPHFDHVGGAFHILQTINVKKIFDNGQGLTKISKSNDLYRWYEELVRKNNNYNILEAGDKFSIDGVKFKIIWPSQTFISTDFNSNSLVIIVEYKNFRCLLTGDITTDAEIEILKKTKKIKADVLKVSHHGSDDASSEEFLRAISPTISIISVNKENIRNFPSRTVVQKLIALPSKVLRTDINGTIIVRVNEKGEIIKISTEK